MTDAQVRESGWLELVAAILLGLAATLTAWAAYQGALADGNSLESYTLSTQQLTEANFFYNKGNAEQSTDQIQFAQFALARFNEDPDDRVVTDYLYSLMSPRLQVAIDWWDAGDADTPFDEADDNPYYEDLSDYDAADELNEQALAGFDEAATQNKVGDQYELAGVILAISLFFGGIATLLHKKGIQVALLAIAALTLVGGAVAIATATAV